MNKTIITILLALVALTGRTQDSVTITFQLASKAKGEKATLIYPDFFTGNTVALHPVTDSEGRWTVKIPAYRTQHIQIWDDNKIQGVVWGALNLFCRPGTKADILLDDISGWICRMPPSLSANSTRIIPAYRLLVCGTS